MESQQGRGFPAVSHSDFRFNVCEFDADVCRGCGRTRQEIRAWKRADKAEQRLILAEADLRLLALQARGRRKFR
ncbi:TPA: DUF1289 domain-containing protein [Pseudomonas aeruginosa]|uniref:DUF1289 domain-containing protein n=1 Tax=Pseudomonas aeruginosa TaxID=287 RepID=UPI00106896C3|nr:DUF1289 domain-containing protein [Pseudomonas aeruginosa]TEG40232.1 DUF1289 domain-containing protein [Pseudomonas aeruginosa]